MRRPNPALLSDDALAVWNAAQRADVSDPITVSCTLMTPMYGGGVEPGKVDHELPIRPGAIRGQLRFWWRLLNGAGREAAEVFADESALWGGIASAGPRASQVALQVDGEPVESKDLVRAKEKSHGFPDYAFILDPQKEPPLLLKAGYEFTFTLRFGTKEKVQREQVIEALRWWTSFGGVGARTRRGLGTVEATSGRVDLKPTSREEVESRGGRMVLQAPSKDALEAWRLAVDTLKSFRQGTKAGEGRNPGSDKHPGRSRWPEPDAIRRRTRRRAPGHEPEHKVREYYPRAAFGLPIVFHFKNRGDPEDCVLEPGMDDPHRDAGTDAAKRDRMASPLFLRPYFDGLRYRPLALLLPGWEERVSVPVRFDAKQVGLAWPKAHAERKQMADLVEPMHGRGTDALTAFMRHFEQQGRPEQQQRQERARGRR